MHLQENKNHLPPGRNHSKENSIFIFFKMIFSKFFFFFFSIIKRISKQQQFWYSRASSPGTAKLKTETNDKKNRKKERESHFFSALFSLFLSKRCFFPNSHCFLYLSPSFYHSHFSSNISSLLLLVSIYYIFYCPLIFMLFHSHTLPPTTLITHTLTFTTYSLTAFISFSVFIFVTLMISFPLSRWFFFTFLLSLTAFIPNTLNISSLPTFIKFPFFLSVFLIYSNSLLSFSFSPFYCFYFSLSHIPLNCFFFCYLIHLYPFFTPCILIFPSIYSFYLPYSQNNKWFTLEICKNWIKTGKNRFKNDFSILVLINIGFISCLIFTF